MKLTGKDPEPRQLLAPDGSLRVADTSATRAGSPRVVVARPVRQSSGLGGWLLAVGVGVAIVMVAFFAMQDPRSIGTQLDDTVARVKNLGSDAEQTVVRSQNAAVDASRNALDGVATAIDDTGISAKVKAALAVDPALSASRIEVETVNGVVRLSGPAPDAAARERATVLAGAPNGVRTVDNRLTLPQPGNVPAVTPSPVVSTQPAASVAPR